MLGKNCAPFRHQVLYNVISHLVFISGDDKTLEGNLLVSYDKES